MNYLRLLRRDMTWYFKPLLFLSLTACLVCAVLTSALLIGESVRGTLHDNLENGTCNVKTLLRFSSPIESDRPEGVLHTSGFISSQLKADLFAFSQDDNIQERDAYCSNALANALKLDIGESFTVRVLTMPAIGSEELMGMPPELKQIRLIYKGIWQDKRAEVNFTNPQLAPSNLFINHDLLADTLQLAPKAVNEAWVTSKQNNKKPILTDSDIWKLSQLEIDDWNHHHILKSNEYFLPVNVVTACPEAQQGLITFAKSLSDSTGKQMDYFFVGAFEGDVFPVKPDSVIISQGIEQQLFQPVNLTCYVSDDYRQITEQVYTFKHLSRSSDSKITSILSPNIPGLTDVSDCTQWIAGLPINLDKIQTQDKEYWEKHKSKPKIYLNYTQAQRIFSPGQCTLLIFKQGTSREAIKKQIIPILRNDPRLFQSISVKKVLTDNIQEGVQFAPLFLGLSLFIIISGLLIQWMLLRLHILDRSNERQILSEYVTSARSIRLFMTAELMLAILPGILLGLGVGAILCLIQLSMLEHIWNEIVGMDKLNFHASEQSFLIAFVCTFFSSGLQLSVLLRRSTTEHHYYLPSSHAISSLWAIGRLSFLRRFRQYRLCITLLVLGIVGTLGVGSFGIKVRGEDGFSYKYVAQTAVPVVPSFDTPFPHGGLPVRVYQADRADCSNLLQASMPTVYGCEIEKLTGNKDYLKPTTAAADIGSLQWIIKKQIGDTIAYPNGQVTLERALKASVFQRGILVDNSTFEALFPDVHGAQFFLIRDKESAEIYRKYLEPFGLTLSTTDSFMARAEHIQNRYLAIFLQLGILGFILGVGSLVLMILRNLHSQRAEIHFMLESGWSPIALFRLYMIENSWVYGLAAIVSLGILSPLIIVTQMNFSVLLGGWLLLTAISILLIGVTLKQYFQGSDNEFIKTSSNSSKQLYKWE